jgi:hypothetical protein
MMGIGIDICHSPNVIYFCCTKLKIQRDKNLLFSIIRFFDKSKNYLTLTLRLISQLMYFIIKKNNLNLKSSQIQYIF